MQWRQKMEQVSRIKEQAILRNRAMAEQRSRKRPVISDETWEHDTIKEKMVICNEHLDQPVIINGKLSIGCKQKIGEVIRKNTDVFSWTTTVSTAVPRFVMEHQLKAYPLAELVAHKKRPLMPDRRQELKEEVFNWLKEGVGN
ncbi:hypothetical protein Tco_0613904 [Tanacetum coccineum]